MTNPAPVLLLTGTVFSEPVARSVAPLDARDAHTDPETGRSFPAREAQPGYDVWDMSVLTEHGGFASVVIRDQAVADAGPSFALPAKGESITWPVRTFDIWRGPEGRRFRQTGFSLAGSVLASMTADTGSRRLASTGS